MQSLSCSSPAACHSGHVKRYLCFTSSLANPRNNILFAVDQILYQQVNLAANTF